MQWYLNQVKQLWYDFETFSLKQVPRSINSHTDLLATLATSNGGTLPRILLVENLVMFGYDNQTLVRLNTRLASPSWMDPIVLFLMNGTLPNDKTKAKKARRKAPQYWLSKEHKPYKCSYSGPNLLYVHPKAIETLLEELHEGICGSHTRERSLSHRALTQGY